MKDFNDPGMHVTWLVQDTTAFGLSPGPTSERDLLLHFGLNYKEWKALFFDVIGVDRESFNNLLEESETYLQSAKIGEFDENDPSLKKFPMLSRICGVLYDAVFEPDEIQQLNQECSHLKSITLNEDALHGLDKLLLMCSWASQLKLGIFLMAN